MTQTNMILLALSPFIMWRVYKRVQRLTVRQRSMLWRHWVAVTLIPALIVMMTALMIAKPLILGAIAGGIGIGAALALMALKRTGFEKVGSDYFYVPYAPIGLFVAMILIARVLYRMFEMVTLGAKNVPQLGSSPLTMLIFAFVAGYYLVFASGLLRWRLAEKKLEQKA
jgi:hypothetical protein